MQKVTLLCVGKLKEPFYAAAVAEYQKRLTRHCKLEIVELTEQKLPDNPSPAEIAQALEKEAAAITERLPKGGAVIAMCIDGPQYDSESFARHLADNEMKGNRQVFVIGGSLGLSKAVIQRADEKISLSKMTFPHQLARVLLLEQIYRACKINAGERYHK